MAHYCIPYKKHPFAESRQRGVLFFTHHALRITHHAGMGTFSPDPLVTTGGMAKGSAAAGVATP